MVEFDPRFTEVIYLDTETYVPAEDRAVNTGSMIVNPTNPNHFLLGGAFQRELPLQQKLEEPKAFWNWRPEQEKETLASIYSFFVESWDKLRGKAPRHPDLILMGIGISRFDIPMIFLKSLRHEIDEPGKLYDVYLKTKMVDLGEVGIPFFPKAQNPVLYPKTTNSLMAAFNIPERKTTGKSVWEMYDNGLYEEIKERTASEIQIVRQIANKITNRAITR